MCLVALAIDRSRRFPLVIAANRDEYYERPTAPLDWWSTAPEAPRILAGRDLQAGGTWFGLTPEGRLALVTNVRDPGANDPQAPSRGEIVPLWLQGELGADRYWTRVAVSGYNGVNVIGADLARGECFHASNQDGRARRLERGLYGLSNAGLDTPWPKTLRLKRRLDAALDAAGSAGGLAAMLFEALADPTPAADGELPSTGISLEWERALSPAFIRVPERGYGTRSSTVLITEVVRGRYLTHVYERSHAPDATAAPMQRHARIEDWPPRPGMPAPVLQPVLAELPDRVGRRESRD